jgi:Ca2+-binding RTX toxin-like protein
VNTGVTLTGNELGNSLISGGGDDTLIGGGGDDRYFVDNIGDRVIELAGEGIDRVFASTSFTLEAGSEVEILRARVHTGLTLIGNELDNAITGGDGADTLMGGGGLDRLYGGGGDDLFRFDTPTGLSVIRDFEQGSDHIQISAAGFGHGLTAGADVVVMNAASAAAAFHGGADGYFIFDNAGGRVGTLYWDATGGDGDDATAIARLLNITALSNVDFNLV